MNDFPRLRQRLWQLQTDIYTDDIYKGRAGFGASEPERELAFIAELRQAAAVEEAAELRYVLDYFDRRREERWPAYAWVLFAGLILLLLGLGAWNLWLIL